MKISSVFILLFCLFITLKSTAQSPELRIPAAHQSSEFAFSKDDKMLVTIGKNEVKIWDVAGSYLLKTLKWKGLDSLYPRHIFLAANQERAVIHTSGIIRFINLRTFDWEKTSFKIPEYNNAALSPDGNWLYTVIFDGDKDKNSLHKIDLTTGKTTKISEFQAKDDENRDGYGFTIGMKVSDDGSKILTTGFDRSGLIFDAKTGKILKKLANPIPQFFLENGNLITQTNLDYTETDNRKPNPRFQIEELDAITFKPLRKAILTFKDDDMGDGNRIMNISNDNQNQVLYQCNDKFYVFDVKKWAFSSRRKFQNEGSVKISDGGKYAFEGNSLEARSLETGKLLKKMGFFPYSPFNLADGTMGVEKGVLVGYKHLHFDAKNFRVTLLPVLEGCEEYDYLQRSIYRMIPTQKKILMVSGGGANNYQLKSYTLGEDASKIENVEFDKETSRSTMEIRTYDDNTVLVTDSDRFFALNGNTWKQKAQIVYGDGWNIAHFHRGDESYIIERSPTDRSKALVHLKKDDNNAENHRIACYDLATKSLIWKYDEPNELSNPIYANEGKQVWLVNMDGQLLKLDAETGKVLNKSVKIPFANAGSIISPSGKYLSNFTALDDRIFGTTQINIVEIATLKSKFTLKQTENAYTNSLFFDKDRYLLTYDEDLKIWDVATGNLLARVILIENGVDWIITAPDGRFDGSKGGLEKMYYVKGKEIIPLEQLSEGFYTPGLLAQIMSGTKSDVKRDIKTIQSPPSVKLTYEPSKTYKELLLEGMVMEVPVEKAQVQVTAEASCTDGSIAEIRLYHNGKLVGNTTRNLVVEDEKNKTEKKVFDLELSEGENRIKVVAINNQRTESKPDEIIFKYKPKTPSPSTANANTITLHMIVIGINKYKNQKYNLNYATADATSFKEMVEKNGTGLFSKTNIVYIGDEKATKEGIVAELEKIKLLASPKDVFIFYYAGHGVVNQNKDFFLVPNDVTQLYGADDALAQKGLSANQLQQFSKEIKAQKQLFILDACQSAGALDQVMASRGAAEEKAIAQLARATGTHWLTASGSEQFASEFTQLGHGTFTYVLLEALSGKADKGGDKKITVKELDAYLQEQVPEVTAKYKGTPQYPASYGFGNDFPIGVVKN
jgi:hypothetical protein